MLKSLALLLMLIFNFMLAASDKIVIGIAGGTGSGKTTLAQKIQEAFPNQAILIAQDSYYKDLSFLPIAERDKVNFDHPDSLDFNLLKQHIFDLKTGKNIEMPNYDFCTHTRQKNYQLVEPKQILIVEGILLFAVSEIRDLFDIKLFVDTDDDVRLLRRIERDINERERDFSNVRDQYLTTVKPMHDTFVEPSKKHADMIVPHGGENAAALSVIISKLREEIAAKKHETAENTPLE
jgi:uridine kinase